MAARRRLGSPPPFFAGAIRRRAGRFTDATDELERETDVRIGEALGEQVSDEDFAADLRHAANGLPGVYLEQNADPDADAIAVRIETRGDVPNADPALLHLCWSPPLCHDPDAHPENCWSDQLLPALADLHAVLDTHGARRRLGVGGNLHLSAALALGWEFREASGWTLQLEHPHVAVETTLVAPDRCGWRFVVEPGPSDGDRRLVVCLHATKDVAQAMTAHARHLPPARATLHVYPPDGRPNRQSVDPDDVNPLAAAVAAEIDTCRTRFATEQTHLYLASPWPLATVLGWNLASSGRLVMHEPDVARDSYRAACELT